MKRAFVQVAIQAHLHVAMSLEQASHDFVQSRCIVPAAAVDDAQRHRVGYSFLGEFGYHPSQCRLINGVLLSKSKRAFSRERFVYCLPPSTIFGRRSRTSGVSAATDQVSVKMLRARKFCGWSRRGIFLTQ